MQNNLDSSQSLALIIQSFTENSKGIETLIVDISKSIDNINKKVDAKKIKKNTASLKTIIGGVNSYVTGMYEVISTISKPSNGIVFDNNFKKDILGIDAELTAQIANGEIDGDSKYAEDRIEITKSSSIPKQILAFSTVINELYKAFDKMGETVANPIHMAMFEIKMKFMQDNIQSMINLMIKSFTNINVGDAKEIINVLTAEPEKTKTIMENTTMQKSSSNVIKEGGNLLQDSNTDSEAYMKNITETTKGRQGLIDVILGVINCFQLLNNLPMPNLLIFRIKLKLSMKQLNLLYSDISKFAGSNSFDVKLVQSMNKSFEAIVETFISLKQIIENVSLLGTRKNMASSKLAAESIDIIFGLNEDSKNQSILVIVSKAINSSYFKDFTNKSVQKQLNTFKLNINIIKSISISISSISFLILPLLLAPIALKLLENAIQIIVKTFDKDTLKQLNDTEKSITKLSKLLLLLSASVFVFVLTGILVKESISSILYVALYCVLVIGIFYLITHLIKNLKELKIEKEILYLSAAILSIAMTVLILALTGQLIQEEWKNFGIVAAFFGVVILGFIGVALGVKLLKELELTQSILYIAGAVFILSLTAMLLALTSRFIIAEWKNFGIVSLFLAGLIGAAMLLAWSTKWIKDAGKSILYISLSVGILVLIMYLLVPISHLVNENWDNLLMTLALLGALVVAVIGVAFAAKLIEKGTKPLILIAITMLIVSSTILILNEAGKNLSWEAFGMFAAVIVLLSGLAIGLGNPAVVLLAYAGAGVLIILGAAFMMFAVSLKTIVDTIKTMKDLNINPKNDAKKIKAPIEVLFDILSYANGLDKKVIITGKRRLRALSKSMGYISNIAEVLQNIATLKVPTKFDNTGRPIGFRSMNKNDFVAAAQNAIGMVRIVASLFGDKKEEKDITVLGTTIKITPITTDELNLITNKSKRKIRQLSKITGFVGNIAETLQNIASLRLATEFNRDGKPIKFKNMEAKDFATAGENAAEIIKILANLFTDDGYTGDIMGEPVIVKGITETDLNNITGKAKRKMRKLSKITGYIGTITSTIGSIATLNIPVGFDEDGQANKFEKITGAQLKSASENVSGIIKMLGGLLAGGKNGEAFDVIIGGETVSVIPLKDEELDSFSRRTRNKMEKLNDITLSIKSITGIIGEITKINIPKDFDPSSITTFVSSVINGLSGISLDNFTGIFNNNDEIMSKLMNSIGSISNISNLVKELNGIDDITKVTGKITTFIGELGNSFNNLFNSNNENGIRSLSRSETENLENFTDFVESISNLSQIDTSNITSVTQAIKSLQEVSNLLYGNLEDFIEGLSGNIKALRSAVDELNNFIEKYNENSQNIQNNGSSSSNRNNTKNNTSLQPTNNYKGSSINNTNEGLQKIVGAVDEIEGLLWDIKNKI